MNALTAQKRIQHRKRPKNTKTLYEQNTERIERKIAVKTAERTFKRGLGIKSFY